MELTLKEVMIAIGVEIFYWTLGGALVFGLYYLLYKQTLKTKGTVHPTSAIVRLPLIIGCINILLIALYHIYPRVVRQFAPDLDIETATLLIEAFMPILTYYGTFLMPLSIGTIAISIIEYKKNLITGKMFGLVLLANTIAPAAIIFFMISSLTSYFGTV